MRKTKKTLAILAIVAMVLTMIPLQAFAATTAADRLGGTTRIDTAIAIADAGFSNGASTVIVAPADDANVVDALAAAPLAGTTSPILLAYKDGSSNAAIQAEISKLGAKNVYLIGAAANDSIANALSGVTVTKLAGADRTATAAAINAKLSSPAGTFVVGYNGTPDALSVASYAAANNYAIVLANPDGSVDASKIVGSKTYLVGGTGVVADYAGATRLAGNDRFLTNDAVVKGLSYKYDKVYIANGNSLVDALAAAPLAAQADAPILLTNGTSVAAAADVNADLTTSSAVVALGGTGAVPDAAKGQVSYTAPATLSVTSVSAINATTLEAVLGRAATADEQTASKFTVTKTDSDGNVVTISMTPTYSADGTKVDLTTGGNLQKGTYAIAATAGATGSATCSVDDRKVGKITILSGKMIYLAATTATVPYKVYDQYGTDVTKNSLGYNITWTSSIGGAVDGNNGTVTITKAGVAQFTAGDTAVLTGVDPTSGVSAIQNLTWAQYATIASVDFGTPILPSGKSNIQVNLATAATIPITVKDDEGNTIKTPATLSGDLIVSTSDSDVNTNIAGQGNQGFTQDVDNNAQWVLNTTNMTIAKTITVNFIVKQTGKSFSTTLSVVKSAAPASVAFGDFSATVAANDDSLNIPIIVTDQFGNTMDADDVASATNDGDFQLISSNSTVLASADIAIAQGGSHKGNIILSSAGAGKVSAKGTTTITVYVGATGKSASMNISVVDQRTPDTLVMPSSFKSNMIGGSTYSFNVDYKDQYGEALTDNLDVTPHYNDRTVYYTSMTLTKSSGDDGAVTLSSLAADGDGGTPGIQHDPNTAQTDKEYTLTSVAGKTGTYVLETKLIKVSDGSTLSDVKETINVVKNNVTGLTYSVSTIPTLAGDQNYDTDTNANGVIDGAEVAPGAYARQVKISATDSSGTSYAVPNSAIYRVTSNNTHIANTVQSSGKWYVAGNQLNAVANFGASFVGTKDATITVYLTTDNGVQTFNQDVTVDSSAPLTQSIALVNKVASDNYTLDSSGKTVTDINFADRAGALAGTGATMYAYKLDQYGVYTRMADSLFTVSDTTKVNSSVAFATTNGFIAQNATNKFILVEANIGDVSFVANKPLYMTLFDGNGAATVKVTINTDTAIAAVKSGTSDAAIDVGETYILTFNQALSAASQAAVITDLKTAFDAVKGSVGWNAVADGTHGSVVFSANGTVVTVTASLDAPTGPATATPIVTLPKADVVNTVGTSPSANLVINP